MITLTERLDQTGNERFAWLSQHVTADLRDVLMRLAEQQDYFPKRVTAFGEMEKHDRS